jgi:hypothetical protein
MMRPKSVAYRLKKSGSSSLMLFPMRKNPYVTAFVTRAVKQVQVPVSAHPLLDFRGAHHTLFSNQRPIKALHVYIE